MPRRMLAVLALCAAWLAACSGGPGGGGGEGLIVGAVPEAGNTDLVAWQPDGDAAGRATVPGEIVALVPARGTVVWVLVRAGEAEVSPRLVDVAAGAVSDPALPSGQYTLPRPGSSADGGRTQIVRREGGGPAYVVDLAARAATAVGLDLPRPGPLDVRYGPDGATAFVSDFVAGGLVRVDAPGQARELAPDAAGVRFGGFDAEGARVVYQPRLTATAGSGQIVIESIDGSDSTVLDSTGLPAGFTADGAGVIVFDPAPDAPPAVGVVEIATGQFRSIAEVEPGLTLIGMAPDGSRVVLRGAAPSPGPESPAPAGGALLTVALDDGTITRQDVPATTVVAGPGTAGPWWWFAGQGGADTPFVALDTRSGAVSVLQPGQGLEGPVFMPEALQVSAAGTGLISTVSQPDRLLLLDPEDARVTVLAEGRTGLTGSFAPGGAAVAVTTMPEQGGLGQIRVVDTAGTVVREIGRGNAAVWLPGE